MLGASGRPMRRFTGSVAFAGMLSLVVSSAAIAGPMPPDVDAPESEAPGSEAPETGQVDGITVAVAPPPVPPAPLVAVGEPPVPPSTVVIVAVAEPPVPPAQPAEQRHTVRRPEPPPVKPQMKVSRAADGVAAGLSALPVPF